jgi:RNA polymerase sigma factor (sigma-70 family)
MWIRKKYIVSDEQLVSDYYTTGDKKYIGILFEKHVKTVFGACCFYFRNKETAQDAVMQIFEKLIEELRKTKINNFKGWLGFVVRNHCVSELRKKKYFLPEDYLDFELSESSWEEEEKINSVKDDQMLEFMLEVMPCLKENQKICIELFYLQEMTYQEISDKTKYSINEVKSFIQNGKRNLKIKIEEKLNKKQNAA